MFRTSQRHVIVVGAGNAALTAAIAAHDSGARVTVIEKAPHGERGGNSRFSGGLFRFAYTGIDDIKQVAPNLPVERYDVSSYDPDQYLADIMRVTDGLADRQLSEVMVKRSLDVMEWMTSIGLAWEPTKLFRVNDGERLRFAPGAVLEAAHEGVGLMEALFAAVESRDIQVLYDTKCVDLIVGQDGTVRGVVVRDGDGTRDLLADAVILASGGFEANVEKRVKYLGPLWDRARVRGTRFNTGEMIDAALRVGAKPLGNWSGCHATPIDANAPWVGELRLTDKTNRLSYLYGVMVNRAGERFMDEGETFTSHTYAKVGREVLAQPGAIAYQIFDQKLLPLLEVRYATGTPVEADTFEELAERLHLPVGAFTQTMARYNAAVNDSEFNPNDLDGKRTEGLVPAKSNWAVAIDAPPYVAYPVTCGITFTFGGIAIDEHARVLDTEDRAIPNLYSTGEMTGGFFAGNYPGGAGLMRGAVFGQIAGRCAAAAE